MPTKVGAFNTFAWPKVLQKATGTRKTPLSFAGVHDAPKQQPVKRLVFRSLSNGKLKTEFWLDSPFTGSVHRFFLSLGYEDIGSGHLASPDLMLSKLSGLGFVRMFDDKQCWEHCLEEF